MLESKSKASAAGTVPTDRIFPGSLLTVPMKKMKLCMDVQVLLSARSSPICIFQASSQELDSWPYSSYFDLPPTVTILLRQTAWLDRQYYSIYLYSYLLQAFLSPSVRLTTVSVNLPAAGSLLGGGWYMHALHQKQIESASRLRYLVLDSPV